MRRLCVFLAAALACLGGGSQLAARELEDPLTAPVALPEPPVPTGRLTDAAAPLRYRLDLTLDPAQERFSGRSEIDIRLARPSHHIDLHGRDLAMHAVSARLGERMLAGQWQQVDPTGIARIRFDEEIPAGTVTLSFRYDAAFNDSPAGLFRVEVDGQWYGWSQFQSIDARSAFPSFDEPGFKTPFEIVLRTPPGLTAISNTREAGEAAVEDGLAVHRFAQTLPLPTYLVAMMAGPFVSAESAVPPTPYRPEPLPLRVLSTRPNRDKVAFPLEQSKPIVRLLEDFFADAFPYPKLDQITSPIMPGAMENAGADLYRDGLLVMDANAPVAQQRKFGMVVAHELGHQWFGDLVTPSWWDDIWLNESFANWIGYHIGHAWKPELNILAGALAEGFEAMRTDELVAGRPIRQPIATNGQIDAAFDTITYGKGGHVIAMIAAYMGEERFRDGVRRHIAAHRHGNATSEDFFRALAEEAGDPGVVAAMKSFVDQKGVPLLLFSRRGDQYTVSQLPYAPLAAEPPSNAWTVPVCVRLGAKRECHLLAEQTGSFTMPGRGPVVPNAGGTSYYRFELTRRHWDALISTARHLTGGEAQALADSLGASVRAGRGTVEELARLARKLVRHEDSYAADAATREMEALVGSGVVDQEGRSGWRLFRSRLYAPLLRKYGFDPRAGVYAREDPERSHRRAQIVRKLVATPRAGKLRRQLIDAATAYLAGDATALDPAWFGPAFDLHIYLGGEEAARALVLQALASEDSVFRPEALEAAAQSGIANVARWLLEELDDPRLRANERRNLLSGIMARSATRDYGYEWMIANLDGLLSGNDGIFLGARLPENTAHFCSITKAEDIATALRPHFSGKPGELALERAIETVRNCGELKARLGGEISREFAKLN